MEALEIERKIHEVVAEAQMDVTGKDCDFSVTIISDEFEGLSTMKRQQKILSAFTNELTSGALHALTIKAFTLAEWNSKSSHLVQISL
ncbi:MAG: BolA/IbaG family iron-sulfur metabolism protein [Pseudomonadales bacterium]|nr:BolA/IbaG family iron-sulfur metabolism protein [Pseudomonadales bacterium]